MSTTLLERALATPELAPDKTSERILDAALELVAASGLRHLTMDAAASRAGVGRMTVYRKFGDREGLIDALAAREARICLAELDRAVDPSLPVAEGIARGLATSLRLIRSHPILDRFSRHEPEAALVALNSGEGAILRMGTAFVASRLEEAKSRGDIAASVETTHAAELLVRLGFSFLLMPDSSLSLDDPEVAAREVEELIAPILGGG
jgi:AcrR family transcriptional regulator